MKRQERKVERRKKKEMTLFVLTLHLKKGINGELSLNPKAIIIAGLVGQWESILNSGNSIFRIKRLNLCLLYKLLFLFPQQCWPCDCHILNCHILQ